MSSVSELGEEMKFCVTFGLRLGSVGFGGM